MSETATLVIAQIPEPKTGTGKKGAWTRYAFKDGNDEFYSCFSKTVFEPAYGLKGQKAQVTYDVDGDFKNIVKIEPAEDEAEEPKLGDGSYIKGQEHPSKQRSIHAAVALQQAVASMTHTIGTSMTPKEASERVLPLAGEYFRWLLQRTGLETDEDIPF